MAEEITLDALREEEKQKIMKAFKAGREAADHYYESKVEPALIRRLDVYRADKTLYKKKFPRLSELSSWVSRDVKVAIDWIMPSLMEAFTGTADPVDIVGVNIADDDNAKKIQQLLSYFITRKNNFFRFLYDFLRDGLELNFACAKVYWKRVEERRPMEVLADAALMQQLLVAAQAGRIAFREAVPVTEAGDLLKVSFDVIEVTVNQPVLENMSPSELRFTSEARELRKAKFVAHRKIVTGDDLKRLEQQGVYQNVDRAMREGASWRVRRAALDKRHSEETDALDTRLSDGDTASKEFELYEGYLKVDCNGDGIYEDLIVHAVGRGHIPATADTA